MMQLISAMGPIWEKQLIEYTIRNQQELSKRYFSVLLNTILFINPEN